MGVNLKHFSLSDFDSPDEPGSGEANMSTTFLLSLDRARDYAGIPFIITSGYRTREHNDEVGGVDGSSHTKGCAADIYTGHLSWADVTRMIAALERAGFRRIGLSPDFVHADTDSAKAETYWDYFDGKRHKA